jgi:phenylacetate-CoA ligase
MNVFDRRHEMMPRHELEQLQLERLQALLVRLARNVHRYREQLADAKVRSLDDLAQLPFTTPEEMARNFPYGMFALPLRRVVRVNSTRGPGGHRVMVGHTRNEIVQWGRLVARQLVAGGLTAKDVVQISVGGGVQRVRPDVVAGRQHLAPTPTGGDAPGECGQAQGDHDSA